MKYCKIYYVICKMYYKLLFKIKHKLIIPYNFEKKTCRYLKKYLFVKIEICIITM